MLIVYEALIAPTELFFGLPYFTCKFNFLQVNSVKQIFFRPSPVFDLPEARSKSDDGPRPASRHLMVHQSAKGGSRWAKPPSRRLP
jgi:hypothetical protein